MRTFRLDKLVHDRIVQDHVDGGGEVDLITLEGEGLITALEAKLAEDREELAEAESEDDKAKERQDVNDVLFAPGRLADGNYQRVKTFDKGHFIRTVTMPNDSWLTEYYASNPNRFPELIGD